MSPATLAVLRTSVNPRDAFLPWFEDSSATLESKLDKAASVFKSKFGSWPTLVYAQSAEISEYRGITIKVASHTLPGMFHLVGPRNVGGAK